VWTTIDLDYNQLTHVQRPCLFLFLSFFFFVLTTTRRVLRWISWWKCTSNNMWIDKNPWFITDLGRNIGRHSISRQYSLVRNSTECKIIVWWIGRSCT
jgi:hypothetical protein